MRRAFTLQLHDRVVPTECWDDTDPTMGPTDCVGPGYDYANHGFHTNAIPTLCAKCARVNLFGRHTGGHFRRTPGEP